MSKSHPRRLSIPHRGWFLFAGCLLTASAVGLVAGNRSVLGATQEVERQEGSVRTMRAEVKTMKAEFPANDPRHFAKVELVLDKKQHFLGENILVHYRVSNEGQEAFQIDIGSDSRNTARRPLRFKVIAVDGAGKRVEDPHPLADDFGGHGMTSTIEPGDSFWDSLPLMRYCDFTKAGTYTLRVYHDLGWDGKKDHHDRTKNELPKGQHVAPIVETKIELVMPSREQARELVTHLLSLSTERNESWGKRASEYADFTTLRYPVYLSSLRRVTHQGDRRGMLAMQGIGEMATPAATTALIELLHHPNPLVAAEARKQLLLRVPRPHLKERRNWSSSWRKMHDLVDRGWRDEHGGPVLELGWKLLREDDRASLIDGSRILMGLGEKEDFPRLLRIMDRVIADMALDKVEQDAYPRPGTATDSIVEAGWALIERGAEVPTNPQTAGESALFMLAVARRKDFRPESWEATAAKLMQHPTPCIRAITIRSLPKPLPQSLYDAVLPRVNDDFAPVQAAALDAAAATRSHRFFAAAMAARSQTTNQSVRECAERAIKACRSD